MIVDIKVPELGESINEVEIGEWLVEIGTRVELDDELVALESDKATVELPSPNQGVVVEILKQQGESAAIGEAIARIDTDIAEGRESGQPADAAKGPELSTSRQEEAQKERDGVREAISQPSSETPGMPLSQGRGGTAEDSETRVMPAASRILAQHDIAPEEVKGTGPGGRILKEDALRAVDEMSTSAAKLEEDAPITDDSEATTMARQVRRVRMTPIRRAIASRLLQAKQEMALLTTFNEVDMSAVKKARRIFGPEFEKKFGVRLGFMSFFVKAAVSALIDYPLVNARIEENDIVYHDSCDIGVAIGGGKGLVVPVIRRAEQLGFAEIEQKIGEFAEKAKNNKLTLEELQGGTFTISNGGVYGSMLSTPIVNPPQSAILGLHAIKDRPVAVDGEVLIRPIMYLALSYDHRIIDGREAVSFLKSIKERIEEPQKLLLEI